MTTIKLHSDELSSPCKSRESTCPNMNYPACTKTCIAMDLFREGLAGEDISLKAVSTTAEYSLNFQD